MKSKTIFNFLAVLVGVGVLAAACAATRLPVVTPADAERATQLWPDTTAEDLSAGRSLYANRCTSCHLPVAPHKVAASEWPMHISEMRQRAHLDPHEAVLVERYLVLMSTSTSPK